MKKMVEPEGIATPRPSNRRLPPNLLGMNESMKKMVEPEGIATPRPSNRRLPPNLLGMNESMKKMVEPEGIEPSSKTVASQPLRA